MSISAKKIAYVSLFTAIATVFNIFSVPMGGGTNFISFVYIPCFFAGTFLGPIFGFLVGVSADVLGQLISPKGDYLPLIGIASGLLAAIPGMIFKIKKLHFTVKILICFILILIFCTAGLNTLAIYLRYSTKKVSYFAYMIPRVIPQLLPLAINVVVVMYLYLPMQKLYNRHIKVNNRIIQ